MQKKEKKCERESASLYEGADTEVRLIIALLRCQKKEHRQKSKKSVTEAGIAPHQNRMEGSIAVTLSVPRGWFRNQVPDTC